MTVAVEATEPLTPEDEATLEEFPRTREECRPGVGLRPCPWVRCKFHLYLEVNQRTGSIKLNHTGLEPWELADTCALDVAEETDDVADGFRLSGDGSGKVTASASLARVSRALGVCRERISQVEEEAIDRLRAGLAAAGVGCLDALDSMPKVAPRKKQHPTCACGCGQRVKHHTKWFGPAHQRRGHGGWQRLLAAHGATDRVCIVCGAPTEPGHLTCSHRCRGLAIQAGKRKAAPLVVAVAVSG